MAERSDALSSAAYKELKTAFEYRHESVVNLMLSGKKTAWMLGDEVPEEILMAGGLVPVRAWGHQGERPNADKYLEVSFGAVWRGLFESVLSNEHSDIMDYLVLANSSDIIQKLYYYLVQIKKIEPDRRLPEIDYVDYWLVNRDFRAQERNWRETQRFITKVESWTGKKISEQDLADAIALCNEYKAALRAFSMLRYAKDCRITGSEALNVIAGSFYLEKDKSIELIKKVTLDAASWPAVNEVRCLYTGSMQDTTEVYGLMEEAGLNVVTEDKVPGDRYADTDADTGINPVRAVSGRYHERFPSSERSFIKDRAKAIPERAAETGAEAVVLFMNHNDESYIWDLPRQKLELDRMGIKVLTVEDQYYPLKDTQKLKDLFSSFAETVRQGR